MNGLIIACGRKDSLGNDRLMNPRGLMCFGKREVVAHIVGKMADVGVSSVRIIVEQGLRESYETVFKKQRPACPVYIEEFSGLDSVSAYIYGALRFSRGRPLIAIADDNLFTFSLAPLVESALRRDKSVLAVRDRSTIDGNPEKLNLGEVVIDQYGRIKRFRDSFTNAKKLHSRLIALDIWVFHPSTISLMTSLIKMNTPSAILIETFLNNLLCHEINEGFWADVGKKPLRRSADLYFSNGLCAETAAPMSLKALNMVRPSQSRHE